MLYVFLATVIQNVNDKVTQDCYARERAQLAEIA
jgi:hypothetical protein